MNSGQKCNRTGDKVGQQNVSERVVVPIGRGRTLKEIRKRSPPQYAEDERATIRRLVQCVEMMAELTKEFTKKR